MNSIRLRVVYDGKGPLKWSGGPDGFGLQDKAETLHAGSAGPNGTVIFDLSLQVKSAGTDAPVFIGEFAHGPPDRRFLYLGWRRAQGGFDQRLKLPLGTISWDDVREAAARDKPLVGVLVDHHPKLTSTGENIGGTRPIAWKLA